MSFLKLNVIKSPYEDNFCWFKYCKRCSENDEYVAKFENLSQTFFEESTGETYRLKKPIKLLIISDDHNKKKYDILHNQCGSHKNSLSKTCALNKCLPKIYKEFSRKYDGIIFKKDDCDCNSRELVCQNLVMLVNKSKFKFVHDCPYIKYIRDHPQLVDNDSEILSLINSYFQGLKIPLDVSITLRNIFNTSFVKVE